MINIKEFRIGSYFHPMAAEGGRLVPMKTRYRQVRAIHEGGAIICWHNGKEVEYRTGGMAAVELNEDILLKIGFIRHEEHESFMFLAGDYKIHITFDGFIEVTEIEWKSSCYTLVKHCEYLHQLQNLYLAIHGEEMKIKL